MLAGFVFYSHASYAQGTTNSRSRDALPADVVTALRQQAAALRVINLEYTEKAENVVDGFEELTKWWMRFDAQRFYSRREILMGRKTGLLSRLVHGQIDRELHEDAFDGKTFYFGDRDEPDLESHGSLAKYLVDDASDPDRTLTLLACAYLDAAGFYFPQTIADLSAFACIESLVLRFVESGDSVQLRREGDNLRVSVRITDPVLARARTADVERERHLLETSQASPQSITTKIDRLIQIQRKDPKRTVQFLLNAKRGYAITGREERTPFDSRGFDRIWIAAGRSFCVMGREIRDPLSGRLRQRVVVDKVHEFAPGLWLPVEFRNQIFSGMPRTNDIIEIESKARVIRFITNDSVPESTFIPVHKPGSLRFDRDGGFAQVSTGGEDLLDDIVNFITKYAGLPAQGLHRGNNYSWLMVAFATGLSAGILLFPRRFRRVWGAEESALDRKEYGWFRHRRKS